MEKFAGLGMFGRLSQAENTVHAAVYSLATLLHCVQLQEPSIITALFQ